MTNYEKYKDEIRENMENITLSAFYEKHICGYSIYTNSDYLATMVVDWLMSEYEEPQIDWSKVEVDTNVLVTDNRTDHEDNKGYKRHFAKYEDGKVYTFVDGKSSFTANCVNDIISWKYAKLYEGE